MLLMTDTVGLSAAHSLAGSSHGPESTTCNGWFWSTGRVRLSNGHSCSQQKRARRNHRIIANQPPCLAQIALLIQLRQFAQILLDLLPGGHPFSCSLLGFLGNIVAGGFPLLPAVTHIQMRTMLGSTALTMAALSSASAIGLREGSKDSDLGQTLNLAQQFAPFRCSINRSGHGPSDVLDSERWKTDSW